MNKTLMITRAEMRATLGRKMFSIFSFGLPILIGIIALVVIFIRRDEPAPDVVSPAAEPTEKIVEGYVDEAGIIQGLPANIPADWLQAYPDREAAQQALEAEEISAYYVIPADYVSSGEIDYVKLTHDPLSSSGYAESMEWLLLYNLAGQDQALAAGLWQPLDLTLTSTAQVTEESAEENWMVELLPTMMTLILYMVIVITSSSLIAAVAEEKKNRVMEILLSSVSPNQFISGKILALGVLGLMMLAAWLGVLWMVIAFGGQSLNIPLDFELPTRLVVWAFVFGLMGYLMYGALMAGIGALAPDVKDTRSLSLVVMSPIILAYMFNIFISNAPEGGLALFATLFPLTSPVSMIMRMTLVDVPLWQLLLAVALQLVTALGIVRLAARLFRAQILLSGQPVSVKRFVGALVRG